MLTLVITGSEAQEALGAALAVACPAGCIIYLEGDLGAGKTTLARGFLRGLGYRGPVKSPTYTLVEPYELPSRTCYHFDLYRLVDPAELEYLGVRELSRDDAIWLVEWPERGAGELPAPDLIVRSHHQEGTRRISLRACSARGEVLLNDLPPVKSS